ncbi:MAG: trigger factor [Chloroflexi bacterium]|nr:trigger factor [Chloroflexota bacterium]
MKIEKQELEDRQVQLTVEVPNNQVEAAMQSAARRISGRAKIAGFRPGKAPYKLVLQRYGEEAIFDEALDVLGQEAYRRALEESTLEPFAPGALNEIVSRQPLTLRFTVPLAPEVDLGAYKELRADSEPTTVPDEAVDQMVDELRQRRAIIETAQRPAAATDVVVLDVAGKLHEPLENGETSLLDEKGVSVLVEDRTNWPIPGIAAQLVGMSAGDEKDIEHTFPEEYSTEALRGRKATFHLHCVEVRSRKVPELTDNLAHEIGDFTDLMDLKLKVRQELLEQSSREAGGAYAQRAIEALVSGSTFKYPPIMVKDELDQLLRDLDRRLQGQRMTLADYLKVQKQTEDDIRKELEPRALERVRRALALGKLAEVEALEVDAAEIDAEIARLTEALHANQDTLRKAIDNPAGRRTLALDLLTEKAVRRLVAIARGEADAPVPTAAQDLQPGEEAPAAGQPQE